MQTTFTIEEIRNYIISQDSLGDVLYNLKSEKIIAANSEDAKRKKFMDENGLEDEDMINDNQNIGR